MAASEGGHGQQHESGNESGHHEFQKNTFGQRELKIRPKLRISLSQHTLTS
jgi:hypothetical protein